RCAVAGSFNAAIPRSLAANMIASIVALGVGRLRASLSSDHARSSETSSAIKRCSRTRSSGGRFLRRSALRQAAQKLGLVQGSLPQVGQYVMTTTRATNAAGRLHRNVDRGPHANRRRGAPNTDAG